MLDCACEASLQRSRRARQGTVGTLHMTILDLDTPSLLVDLDRMEANLDRAASYAEKKGLNLRPHTKTHKSPLIGGMQLDRGATGLTVAKVGEAEVMATAAAPNLLVAYPVWGEAKWARLVDIVKTVPITVALDNLESAAGLQRHARRAGVELGILVEADLGMRRCGLPPGEDLLDLAKTIARMPPLRLEGVMFYPGHVNLAAPGGEQALAELAADLGTVLDGFAAGGLPTGVVSGGSTPTLFHSHRIPGLTEIRPGTYVFNDCTQVAMGACGWIDCAASVLTTVVSTPRPNAAVIDGGSKTFTSDPLRASDEATFGRVLELPGSRFHKMNEEHGMIDTGKYDGPPVRIGQRLRIVPNHVCVTVNMHETAHGIRDDVVEQSWAVEGRGKLQ